MASQNYNVSLNINANAQSAEKQLQNLQKQLQQISNMRVNVGVDGLKEDIEEASQAAMKLSAHLATATNPQTGNLDFTKFYSSIQKSGASLEQYGAALQRMGPAGQKAFVSLADSISKAEIPLKRTSKLVDGMWDNLKKTVGWQLSSSMIHGVIRGVQQATYYAKDLNKSLTDIRIVTGQSADQMAQFARQANQAAKNLSTTTTDYTKASLIYYQQGLSEAEVKARTETTIKMANATGTTAQTVSDQMTAIWNNYDNGSKSLEHYADVMTALGAATASSTDEIAQGLQKFAAISNTVGLSYEYAASALATITAESRESADVVGNALKTLFSRIQGLQLGETLEDGTTLNKYSTALAKVGISIKDQAGGLKDMDDILDEMGSKWDTLARDEKMALAQTVAGVRQYTQLMTLMENWDDFKQNLNTANTSAGTLDVQADIYAESWEAASNRVRAAWEGLWDTMINSEGFIGLLDGLSGIIKFADKLAESMGGATGVLSSFAGIATKLLAPKLSQGLRDTAYNVAMLFGGEERMKKNRSDFLQKAGKQISVEGEFGSLYGAHESAARQTAMMNRIQSAQDYADNYDHMTDLQRMVEGQYADAVAQADARVIGAAQSLDERKDKRYDARMEASFFDDDNTVKNFLDLTSGEAQVVTADQAMDAFLAQFQDTSLGMEDIQANADYARLEAAQVRAQNVHKNQTINEQTVGENLGGFAKSLQSLYDVVNSPDTKDSTKHIAKLKNALDDLSESGYDDEKTKKRIESIKSALDSGESVNFDGLYNDLMSYQSDAAAGGAGGLSSTFNKWLTEEFAVLTGEKNLSAEERRRQSLESGRKSNMQRQNNVDWANTMVTAGEAVMFAMSAGQSLQAANEAIKKEDIGGTLMSTVGAVMSFGMSLGGFEKLFKSFSKTAPNANKWAIALTLVTTLLGPAIDLISDKIINSKEKMQKAVDSANDLQNAYATNQKQHLVLQQTIKSYQSANKALTELRSGTDEWTKALYSSNAEAINIIAENNLQEGIDYQNIGGQYQISNRTLERLEKESQQQVENSKIAADMGQIDVNKQKNEFQKDKLYDRMLDSVSPKTIDSIIRLGGGLAGMISGAGMVASGLATAGVGSVASYGTLAAPSIYAGTAMATMGAATAAQGGYEFKEATEDMIQRKQRGEEFNKALDYIEKNGIDILSKDFNTISSTLGISTLVAQELLNSTGIITEWYSSIQANSQAQKLATESTTRTIIANNENAQAIEQDTKMITGASKQYTEAYDIKKDSLDKIFKSGNAQQKYDYADEVKKELGLDNLDNFHWTGDDSSKSQLTYTYLDENNQIQEGAISYGAIISAQSHQAGVDNINNYVDAMSEIYSKLESSTDEKTAGGLLSLLTGDNFVNATTYEMEAALGKVSELADSGNIEDLIQQYFGMSSTDFKKLFNIDANANLSNWFKQFEGMTTTAQNLIKSEDELWKWFNGTDGYEDLNSSQIAKNLSQDTLTSVYKNFKEVSLSQGKDVGVNMLKGITQVLSDSGLSESNYDAAMQRLLAIDWSDSLTASGAAADIVEQLGGHLDTATDAWQAFAAAMEAASGAIPDFSKVINQLTQLAGALQGLSQGDLIDADIVQQLLNMNPDLEKYFSKHWSGKYTFIGTDNDVVQGITWDEMNKKKQEASKIEKDYKDYTEGEGKGKKDNNKITAEDFVEGSDEDKNHAIKLANIAGYKDPNEIIQANETASKNYSDWTTGKKIDDNTTVRRTSDGGYEKWNGLRWDKVTDASEIHKYETQYNTDQTAYNTTQGVVDGMINDIRGLDEVSGEWKPEEIEQAVSTADNAAEVFDKINEGQAGLVEGGIISDSALKGLEALPGKSEATTEALNKLKEAKTNLDNVANGTDEEKAAAQKAYDEAYALAELEAQIDATAAARGLDAEALRAQAHAMKDIHGALPAEIIAEMAAEELELEKDTKSLADAYDELSKAMKDVAKKGTALKKLKKLIADILDVPESDLPDELIEAAEASGLLARVAKGEAGALGEMRQASSLAAAAVKIFGADSKEVNQIIKDKGIPGLIEYVSGLKGVGEYAGVIGEDLVNDWNTIVAGMKTMDWQEILGNTNMQNAIANVVQTLGGLKSGVAHTLTDITTAAAGQGFEPVLTPVEMKPEGGEVSIPTGGIYWVADNSDPNGLAGTYYNTISSTTEDTVDPESQTLYKVTFKPVGGGSSGGGGGGGGGGKQPKKTAQTRRSQVVKRYKNIDSKRSTNKNRRDNLSKKTDKVYGEARITNLQKENKLLAEGLRLNEKKAEEALKNLKIDEESLRKMTKKYGYELELDSEGNIKNYEEILGDIYDQLHALEADGEISEEEEKVKERLDIMKEEIEGAMEDWEDTLKQLEELNNEYEELIDEMHSNELEQITYKLEFELELNELDTEWYDFLNEQIGDDFTQAVDTMDLITEKIKIANDNINLYKQSVTDLMEDIENDPNRSLITGYLEDGVLTDEEAEILKEAYSGIIEQLSALAEAKTSAEELLVSIFEGYKERIDFDTTALEHYTSLLEHFGNVVDIVGQKQLGLSDQFMENMAKMRIQQSRDVMSAAQSELAAYEQIRAEAEQELARAREEGRTNDIDYWQQQLDDANTSIQEARDKLVTSFEDNLNAIADAFDKAVERIVQTFSDAVYAFGGLEGLSEDYSFIRENTELMAQDYEKIYELSKLNRNINKALNDNNIIAGKQKMIELQKEINDLQASGAELSKYDLEYLQAKYELRLAEIELENAQNAKETVRLSKDSEGNWSYVYTASTEKIDEAQQKYEDALYKMQNLSYEYIDEMSEKIISASQAMMEEIQNLNKNNFENEQEYLAEINRIKAKYAESLGVTEEELNKALVNNEELYDKDWQSYSNKTGYAISESQNWIDRYAESTLGTLMKSTSDVADYMNNFSIALDELTNSIYRVAGDYYNGVDDAFAAAGITKEDFASFVTTNTKAIMDASANAKKDVETQTSTLVKEYGIQADKVTDIQRILDTAIDVYGPYIREIRDILRESAALTKELQNKDATYTYKQAADLFNSKYGEDYKIEMDAEGRWNKTVEGVKNEILQKHAEAKTDEEKKHYADMYTWLTSYILPYVTSLDTGGYTGEWGASGRLAMLHEKELILNANDTANFLDALNVSRELVNRVIEMNARASSFGIGGLSPSSIQDFAQNLEQQVTITAEFPNAVDHNEIEEAFASLINTASQYANRK